ncbi:Hypothetical predicted protein, partial [Scomber scombrus]
DRDNSSHILSEESRSSCSLRTRSPLRSHADTRSVALQLRRLPDNSECLFCFQKTEEDESAWSGSKSTINRSIDTFYSSPVGQLVLQQWDA